MDTQNEVGAISLYVRVISPKFIFALKLADAQSIQANNKRYFSRSNESDLREDLQLVRANCTHSVNSLNGTTF